MTGTMTKIPSLALALLLIAFVVTQLVSAQVTEEWVARYIGQGDKEDRAKDIAVDDSSGNVYVTGEIMDIVTGWDYVTIKYSVSSNLDVYIDIKPGSCPNPLNVESKGVLPVAVLGTEDFDVYNIDPTSTLLTRGGDGEGVLPIRWSYKDVATPFEGELYDYHDLHGDGYMDLTLKFNTQKLVKILNLKEVTGQTIQLILTGNLREEAGGTPIKGSDCIKILKTGKKKKSFLLQG